LHSFHGHETIKKFQRLLDVPPSPQEMRRNPAGMRGLFEPGARLSLQRHQARMDGQRGEAEKADWLKLEVKRLAAARRERRHMQGLEMGMDGLDVANASDSSTAVAPTPVSSTAAALSSNAHISNDLAQDSGSDSWMRDPSMSSMTNSTPQSSCPATEPSPSAFVGAQVPVNMMGIEERDLSYVVFYLDVTFPFLYPFYRPAMLDGGRAWLLVTLMRNKSLFHIGLSLTGYIFSEVLKGGGEAQADCKVHNWDGLQNQQELAMKELQADMQELNNRGVQGYLKASAQVLSSMVQVLSFEVAIANTGNWQIHLHAGNVLFHQIMEHHGKAEDGTPCWYRVLRDLGDGPIVPFSQPDRHVPWIADQASLRFFTASLLFFDALSATTLEKPPCLLQFHDHLLTTFPACCDSHPSLACRPHLDMEDFFGVPNWVVLAIGATATLDAWKKEQKQTNSLSMTQLVSRAAAIEQDLRAHIHDLDLWINSMPASGAMDPNISPAALPSSIFSGNSFSPADRAMTARIWAQAALTYLSVVVSGWQPASAEIRESITLTISLFHRLSSPANLRTVVWPFAVTGCLAGPGEEQGFRDLVAAMGALQVFGTIREALNIMENVWGHRSCLVLTPDTWDLAACFNSLGHPALLI
jgi:hypothetical protein